MDRTCRGAAALAWLAALAASPPAGAWPAWDAEIGVLVLRPANPDATLQTYVPRTAGTLALGIPERFESPGVGLRPGDLRTLSLSGGVALGAHLSLRLDLGVPPRTEVRGHGIAAPPGAAGALFRLDLGDPAINPLFSPRQWSPVLALEYQAGAEAARLRPFASLGASYTWFTDDALNPAFADALDQRFGQPLAIGAGRPGRTTAQLRIEPAWAPVIGAGLRWRLGSHWSLRGALAYAPMRVEGSLRLRAADGTLLSRTDGRLQLDGIGASLALCRHFGH